jgi:aspartyl-tRNA(Asn)/glutamyl-tRNA(Gln) amidotransferase subunit A
VAAGLVGFGIGTETWGSILCPSAFCGLTGLRPTYGLVSRYGGMVLSWSFDKAGPMARSAADCRTVLRAILGPDDRDSATSSAIDPLARMGARAPVSQLRGALFMPEGWKGGDPESKAAFERAVGELHAGGLQLEDAKLPDFPFTEIAALLITVEALSSYEKFFADGSIKQMIDPSAQYQMEINSAVTGADTVKAWRMRAVGQEKAAEFFARYDVLVAPNFLSAAPGVEEDLNVALAYGDPVGAMGNSCGLPSLALPIGLGKANMPCGMQVMGPPYSEATLFDVGEMYQSRTRHNRERPRV